MAIYVKQSHFFLFGIEPHSDHSEESQFKQERGI